MNCLPVHTTRSSFGSPTKPPAPIYKDAQIHTAGKRQPTPQTNSKTQTHCGKQMDDSDANEHKNAKQPSEHGTHDNSVPPTAIKLAALTSFWNLRKWEIVCLNDTKLGSSSILETTPPHYLDHHLLRGYAPPTSMLPQTGLALIAAYAPSANAAAQVQQDFLSSLQRILTLVQKKFTIILAGDFNAQVGTRTNWFTFLGSLRRRQSGSNRAIINSTQTKTIQTFLDQTAKS